MSKPTIVGPVWVVVLDITEGPENGLIVQFTNPKLEIVASFSIREVVRYFPEGVERHSRVKLWGCLESERFILGNIEQVRLRQVKQSRPGTAK